MRGVRHQLVTVEIFCEQLLAERDQFLAAHLVDAGLEPDVLRRLDDEGRGGVVEFVGVRLEPAVVGLLEREGEGVEHLVRPEPDEAAFADLDVGLERGGVFVADKAVDAVGGDDEVGVDLGVVLDVGLEHEFDAEFLAARLQDVEKPLAADAAEAVAAGGDGAALEVHVDVVPVIERLQNLLGRHRVRGLQIAERLVGEHHAPAERVVGTVALDDADVVGRIALLHQEREIEAGGAAADADNSHELLASLRGPAYTV